MQARKIIDCRLCGSRDLEQVLDLGEQALAGRFPGPGEPDAPRAPLQLAQCLDCGLVQLAHDFDPDELYRQHYGYRSGINTTMTRHLAGISEEVRRRVGLRAGDVVLDIASNDGTLLRSYPPIGLRRVGIDPTIAQYRSYYPGDVLTVADFFTAERFRELVPDAKARVVTSIAMFYDLPDPNAFVGDVAAILAPDGMWVLEQSDLLLMIEARSFDTVCHEHLEYYGVRQVRRLVEGNGLRVCDLETNLVNGGSARFYVCHADGPYPTNEAAIEAHEGRERAARLDRVETMRAFGKVAEQVRAELMALLEAEHARGRRIHLYGASTKGNVLLQYCGIDTRLVEAAAERNPSKWGARTPGTNIPIVSEEESRAAKPDYFLVLPWHFRDEFIEREAAFIERGGKLIFPMPKLEIYPSGTRG